MSEERNIDYDMIIGNFNEIKKLKERIAALEQWREKHLKIKMTFYHKWENKFKILEQKIDAMKKQLIECMNKLEWKYPMR